MKVYLAAFRARFRTVLRYRGAAAAGIFTQVFFGLILVMILESWYAGAGVAAGGVVATGMLAAVGGIAAAAGGAVGGMAAAAGGVVGGMAAAAGDVVGGVAAAAGGAVGGMAAAAGGMATAGPVTGVPISLAQAVSYAWLGQAFLALQTWQSDPELRDLIRSGEIARDLLRPADLYGLWYARALGWKVAGTLLRFWAIFLLGGLIMPAVGFETLAMQAPASLAALACFMVLILLAAVLSAAITVGISCFQFRQVSANGATAIVAALSTLFSGLVVPLPLLSGPIARIAAWLPFRGLADLPFRFWTGALPPVALPGILLTQGAWLALLTLGGWAWVRSSMASIAVAGG